LKKFQPLNSLLVAWVADGVFVAFDESQTQKNHGFFKKIGVTRWGCGLRLAFM